MYRSKALLTRILAVQALLLGVSTSQTQANPQFQRINLEHLYVGVEYTFQNRMLLNDPAESPHDVSPKKYRLMLRFFRAYQQILSDLGFGPVSHSIGFLGSPRGVFYRDPRTPNDELFRTLGTAYDSILHSDMRVVEVAEKPKKLTQLESTANLIYAAASKVNLKPYLLPGGMWSGGAHFNIGSARLEESPFIRFPNLLPNLLAYFDQHASLLYGFGEAFDVGNEGTAVPYHGYGEVSQFRRILKDFSVRYEEFRKIKRPGLHQRVALLASFLRDLKILNRHESFINVERLLSSFSFEDPRNPTIANSGDRNSIEIRTLRMPPTAAHVAELGWFFARLLEKLSEPGLLVQPVAPVNFDIMLTATAIEADWQLVKKDLNLQSPLLDEMIDEQTAMLQTKTFRTLDIPTAEIFSAFSPLAEKGRAFEMRVPSYYSKKMSINGRELTTQTLQLGEQTFEVAYLHSDAFDISPEKIRKNRLRINCQNILLPND